MEQQCKNGGERLRNRDVVNEDRISGLPEDLLWQILSSLETETVIATSVLSKRWRSLWKMVPKLTFCHEYYESGRRIFSEKVCSSLLSHKAPVLESLHLLVGHTPKALAIRRWIKLAFSHHVRELVLSFPHKDDAVKSPSVLCSYNNTLEVLKLEYRILVDFPSRACFKSLRELHLCYVDFKDEESVSNLLCGCPALQVLVVERHCGLDVETFTIAVPSLQRLTIKDGIRPRDVRGYIINSPSLKYLNIEGLDWIEFCPIENAPKLVEAKIIDSDIENESIPVSLTSAKRLSLWLSPLKIKYPTGGIIFYQLLSLELSTNQSEWWNLLSLMLDASPQLQILKLIRPGWIRIDQDCLVDWKWNQPKRVPECMLFHLETFVWTTYEWERKNVKEVAAYILKNARRLKKATISTKPIEPEEIEKLEKRLEMLNELASEVKASSNSCHFVFKSE